MPVKNGKTAEKFNDEWKGYVNFSPDAKQREAIIALLGNGKYEIADYIRDLNESGYNVTFSYDEGAHCHRLAVTGKTQRCPNQGYTLSIRSSSPERCMGIAAYYISYLCESGDWLVDKASKEVW